MWDRAVCRVSPTPGLPILLIGDSHVDRFKELLASYPLLITKQNCTALEYGERRECNWSDIVRDVRELHVTRIVLVAHWARSYTPAQYLKLQQDLAQVGVPVTLLLPTPEGPAFDPATYLKRGTFPEFTPVTQAQVRSETFDFRAAMRKIGQDDDNVTLVDPLPVLCPSRCRFALDGTPIYRDGNHLTIQGARLIVSQISQTFLNDDIRQRHGSNRSPF